MIYDFKMTASEDQIIDFNEEAILNQTLSVRPDFNSSLTLQILNSNGEIVNTNYFNDTKVTKVIDFRV